jgi:hypothetical protein
VVDHFTFGERFRLSFPNGAGNPEGTHVTAGGDDVSSGMQRAAAKRSREAKNDTHPTGTNCVGAPIGGAIYGFANRLNGRLSSSVAKLDKHGSVSIKVRGSKIASCNAKTCDRNTCKTTAARVRCP